MHLLSVTVGSVDVVENAGCEIAVTSQWSNLVSFPCEEIPDLGPKIMIWSYTPCK